MINKKNNNDICIAYGIEVCDAFKNAFTNFFMCFNALVCSYLHLLSIDCIYCVTNLYIFVK
jgi:hypothetical protein